MRQSLLIFLPFVWGPLLILLPALGVGDPRECKGEVAFPPSFGVALESWVEASSCSCERVFSYVPATDFGQSTERMWDTVGEV